MRRFFSQALAFWQALPALVAGGHKNLKGRTYLFVGAILVVTVGFSAGLAELAEQWRDDARRTGAQMLTSAQATEEGMFQYLVKVNAGRTLVEGPVSTDTSCVTLPGDQYHGCFAYVSEQREEYVTRIETYECGTDKNPQTCTRVVQEWQNRGYQKVEAETAMMLGVELPYGFVPNRTRNASVGEVREPSEGGFFRNNDHYFYESNTVRYSYQVAENNYEGTVWLSLGEDGIGKLGGFWRGDTIANVIASHTAEPVWPNVLHIFLQTFLIGGALFGVVALVGRDLADGHDHGF